MNWGIKGVMVAFLELAGVRDGWGKEDMQRLIDITEREMRVTWDSGLMVSCQHIYTEIKDITRLVRLIQRHQ